MIYKLNAEVSRYIAYTHEFLITYAGTLFKQASNTILNKIFFFRIKQVLYPIYTNIKFGQGFARV